MAPINATSKAISPRNTGAGDRVNKVKRSKTQIVQHIESRSNTSQPCQLHKIQSKKAVAPKLFFHSRTAVRPVYHRCNFEGLRVLAERRGVHLPNPANSAALVKLLRDRDAQQTFDFMGLPAEIRNTIYYLLLVIPEPGSVSFNDLPLRCRTRFFRSGKELLRTCRQVYQEAAGVIIAEVPLTCAFQTQKAPRFYLSQYESFLGGLRHNHHPLDALYSRMSYFPRELRKAERINLIIKIDDPVGVSTGQASDGKWHARVVSMLRSFVAVIMDDHNIRTLDIVIDVESSMLSCDQKQDVLLPLTRLYGIPRVNVKARGIPAEWCKSLSNTIQAKGRKQNLLMHCFRLAQEAQAFIKILGPAQESLSVTTQHFLDELLLAVPLSGCHLKGKNVDVEDEPAFHAARSQLERLLYHITMKGAQARLNRIKRFASFENLPGEVFENYISDLEALLITKELRTAMRKTQGLINYAL